MELVISDPEKELLLRLLDGQLGDVRSAVRRTHTPEWHDGLKQEEELLKKLIEQLRND